MSPAPTYFQSIKIGEGHSSYFPYIMYYIENNRTPIQQFYAGQSIFITGGTGFIGKTLIEKLLRSCPDISKMYLLIRSKRNKDPQSRLNELFESPLYNQLKEEVPHFRKKIIPIVGDLHMNGLGLSENDKNVLISEISIVFHMAATVRFNEKIKICTILNVTATIELFNIIKCMKNLKSFIHVSTIYSQFHLQHIEERFYTNPVDYKSLIGLTNILSEDKLEKFITEISGPSWINTYIFTKAVAEAFFNSASENIPMGIFRPAIVTATANEPINGWIDNFYGSTGLTIFSMLGWMRFYNCDNVKTNLIPADITINALITSAWDVFNQQFRRGKNMLIYNCVPPNDMPTWTQYTKNLNTLHEKYPCNNSIWLPKTITIQRTIIYKICIWLFHLLPAFLIDTTRMCMGLQPKIWKLYKKMHTACEAVAPFCLQERIISNNNLEAMWKNMNKEDQKLFKFDMKTFDWPTYFTDYYKGIRLYILNEDDTTLNISRIRYKRLYWMHQFFKTVLISCALLILWKMFVNIFY